MKFMLLGGVLCALVVGTVGVHAQEAGEPPILEFTEKLRGGRTISPLEQSIEQVIRDAYMMQGEGEDDGNGGFETETEVEPPDAPSADDARFEALQEYIAKHTALENVSAALYFLTTNPKNSNNTKVQQLLTGQARSLTGKEQADLKLYQAQRDSLDMGNLKGAAKNLDKWAKGNSANAFAPVAEREAAFLVELDASNKAEKGQKRSRILVRVGVVALVLLLVGVVILGAVG